MNRENNSSSGAPVLRGSPRPEEPETAAEWLQRLGDDAMKWAQAFCEMYPGGPAVDVMVGWFANAIEHSSDVRRGRQIHSDEALLDHLDSVMWQRRFLRDLAEGRPQ